MFTISSQMHSFVRMRQALLLLSVLSSAALSAYIPGTPGAAWTKEEVLAVKAKLWQSFVQRGFLIKQAGNQNMVLILHI